ncbi:MAG: MinD/ParA family protein [Deltaproteobacteria bacterium]|nr:MinD/ParA family protein [Deltaproteobacteria bacterium]
MSRIITVTSGKGGVGKTNISVNTALYLAGQGYKTCLFDADMGLANVDILLGYYPEFTLEDVLMKKKTIKDVIIKTPSGLDIIPGSSGVKMLADPEPDQMEYLINSLSEIDDYDFFFFDTSAGISKNVISFCLTSPEIVLVITPEPTSITDAYALLKILCLNNFDSTVMIAINQCMSMEVANKLYSKFKEVVQKNLNLDIFPLGTIPLDPHVSKAVKQQEPLISVFPNSDASKGIKNIARYLVSKGSAELTNFELYDFWQKYIERLNGELVLAYDKSKKKPESAPEKLPLDQRKKLIEQDAKPDGKQEKITTVVQENRVEESSVKQDQVETRDVYEMLEGLVKGILAISSELGAIRKMMESDRARL